MTNGEPLTDHSISVIRQSIVDTAKLLIGVPYKIGQNQADFDAGVGKWNDLSKPPVNLDCSGLVAGVFKKCGLKIPDGSQSQWSYTIKTEYPQDGDLGFFGKDKQINAIYHVGIYTVNGVIEARAFDATANFPTGRVIVRPADKWTAWKNFTDWRVHPKLIQIKAV